MYGDTTGKMFFLVTALIGAAVGGAAGAVFSYVTTGEVTWESVVCGAAAGAAVGVVGGAAGAYYVTGTYTASTGAVLSGSSAAAAGAATVGSALIVPKYVNNAGSFISWIKQNFESTKTVMSLDQVKQLFELARSYGVEISADLAGHPGSAWEMAHIHLGKNRIHIAVAEEAIEWILEQLN